MLLPRSFICSDIYALVFRPDMSVNSRLPSGRITNGKSVTYSCMGTFSRILLIVSMLAVKLSSIPGSSVGSTGK